MNGNHVCVHAAWGGPGMEPRWTRGAKDGVGCSYAASSRIWFTLAQGIVTEVYFPTLDTPQIRDLQLLATDGHSYFQEERRDLRGEVELLEPGALGYRVVKSDPGGRFKIEKYIHTHPHFDALMVHGRLVVEPGAEPPRLYLLCAPHLDCGGWNNYGEVTQVSGRTLLLAHKANYWLALGANCPIRAASCGYVGVNDGWTDLHDNFQLDWRFDCAGPGNIALTAALDLPSSREFSYGLGFGTTPHSAINALLQSLGLPRQQAHAYFLEQWRKAAPSLAGKRELTTICGDGGKLYHTSTSLLLAHEDKTYPGAMIASLSIPWGEAQGDDDLGGYHLVWTRDLVESATGLLTAGYRETPLRALIYLATTQRHHGGFYQNFWVDGTPYWRGLQLDEISFPLILAWRLRQADALGGFDPLPMIKAAAGYIIRHGPATAQERWEEAAGFSPSTLAATIAGLICAADLIRAEGDKDTAEFIESYADFLEAHVDTWTVTTQGSLLPGIARHFIRIHPLDLNNPQADEDPNHGLLRIANRPPGAVIDFPAKDVVDAGFLELVRYGIRRPGDPLIEDSLRVVDKVLRVETPSGPCWRRYNHDGYGQRDDGGAFRGWGRGRLWPLLAGERGHYELAAGRDPKPYLKALEGFAQGVGLLPEQIWDGPDIPEQFLRFGGPTGSAMPLMWAQSEYIKLVHSVAAGSVVDRISVAADRYLRPRPPQRLEIWQFHRQIATVPSGWRLRIQAPHAFSLHWSADDWAQVQDTRSTATALGIEYVDIALASSQRGRIRFTFRWLPEDRWEGRDYAIEISAAAAAANPLK